MPTCKPAVSVIIPSYNRTRYIGAALDSLAYQTFTDLEAIVVDDGSTDDTEKTVYRIAESHPGLKLRYITQKHSGISAARNRGISEASGEWIAFLDADDLWVPEKLERQMMYLEKHPACRIIFTRYMNFYDGEIGSSPNEREQQLMDEQENCYLASAAVHKSLFDSCGMFDEKLIRWEDSEWVTRIRLLGIDIGHHIEEALYLRRIHGKNISLQSLENGQECLSIMLAAAIRNVRRIRKENNQNP